MKRNLWMSADLEAEMLKGILEVEVCGESSEQIANFIGRVRSLVMEEQRHPEGVTVTTRRSDIKTIETTS